MRKLLCILVLFCLPFATSCKAEEFQTLEIIGKNQTHHFTIEIADAPEEQQIGLMYRTEMPQNHGMLFIFPDSAPRSFWMKNTYLPLDLIYIGTDKTIKHIHKNAQPESLAPLPSRHPVQYVLEVNGGLTDEFNIQIGDQVKF